MTDGSDETCPVCGSTEVDVGVWEADCDGCDRSTPLNTDWVWVGDFVRP